MSNLTQRILTALVAGGGSLALIWFSRWGLFAFSAIVGVLSFVEYLRLSIPGKKATQILSIALVALLWIFLAGNLYAIDEKLGGHHIMGPFVLFFLACILMVALSLPFSLFNPHEEHASLTVASPLFGLIYTVLPFILYFVLSYVPFSIFGPGEYNPRIAMGVLLLNWTLDTFAYFGGRFLGRHKLFERISPKKTWEGAVIGLAGCIGLGVLFQFVWPLKWNWIMVSAIIGVFSQIGDLGESMFKRNVHIKDSGSLLPGHGGFLDRFDGMFYSTPLVFLYTVFFTK